MKATIAKFVFEVIVFLALILGIRVALIELNKEIESNESKINFEYRFF